MSNRLEQLRDAVVNRGREVEVTPDGEVRETRRDADPKSEPQKATKLAPRSFSGVEDR